MNHGHVTPNADGAKARCGGPGICAVCSLEAAALERQRFLTRQGEERISTGPFGYRKADEAKSAQIKALMKQCEALHDYLLTLPPCRERSLAVTKLEEVAMWGNKGIVFAKEGSK